MLSRAEGLEQEQQKMKDLSLILSSIHSTDSEEKLEEARNIISGLRKMNLRWNISGLEGFLKKRQTDLFSF